MIKSHIGQRIRKYRKEADMTQETLAKFLGVSRPTISSWEIDRTEPSMQDVQKIADALGCAVSDIIGDYHQKVIENHNLQRILELSKKLEPEQQKTVIEHLEYLVWKNKKKDTQQMATS